MNIRVGITGEKELNDLFKDLPKNLEGDTIRDVLSKAANPLVKTMRAEIYTATKSGRIRQLVRKSQQKRSGAVFVKPSGKESRKVNLPVNIGYLWTFGHKGIRGNYKQGAKDKGWLKRSWNRAESQIYAVLNGDITKIIDKNIQKYDKRSRAAAARGTKNLIKAIIG